MQFALTLMKLNVYALKKKSIRDILHLLVLLISLITFTRKLIPRSTVSNHICKTIAIISTIYLLATSELLANI